MLPSSGNKTNSKFVPWKISACWIRIWSQKLENPAPRRQNWGKTSKAETCNPKFPTFGHNSSPRKFWGAPLGGNESYRPPGVFEHKISEKEPQKRQHFGNRHFQKNQKILTSTSMWAYQGQNQAIWPQEVSQGRILACRIRCWWSREAILRSREENMGEKNRKNSLKSYRVPLNSSILPLKGL